MERAERDRRKHRRLPIKLTVVYQAMDSENGALQRGDTLNVSTGGLLMETYQEPVSIEIGHLVNVDLQIEPTDELFELGGQISGVARVTRILDTFPGTQARVRPDKNRIALQFCQRPTFEA